MLVLNALQTDVAIIGGGLAGLTLARELRTKSDLDVTVLERKSRPFPAATHKIGESTVEIGAHYLSHTLDLKSELEENQLPKHGLRLFFGDYGDDIANADELGTSRLLAVPTWQVDRGTFEDRLSEINADNEISVLSGHQVTSTSKTDAGHESCFRTDDGMAGMIKSRWLIDAASRASPLKRQLGLARDNDHNVNAIWFRVPQTIRVETWSQDGSWTRRCEKVERWLSTNHLMGPGYWVWIIPLKGGITSIGIVADPALHPLKSMKSFTAAQNWLGKHQPLLAAELEGVVPLDFRVLRNYSHDCQQVFDADRWSLIGEAGMFLDPFYSPGTDFIAIGNGFVSDLILRDMRGERIGSRVSVYERLYRSFVESTYSLYFGQYPGFGDREMMVKKTVWDYAYYWGVLAPLFFSRAMFDVPTMTRMHQSLAKVQSINTRVQQGFRMAASAARRLPPEGRFVDQCAIPVLSRLNAELTSPPDASAEQRVRENSDMLESLADRLDQLEASPGECSMLSDLGYRLYG